MLDPDARHPKTTVAGHPVLVVRRALRKLRQINTWDSAMLETAAGLPAGAGPELAKALAAEGLIRKVQRGAWTICQSGMTFAAATAANRLTRATADRALAAFMGRVARVNSDPYFLGEVPRVALFGSMLNADTDRPSDVDLAVQIVPKVADWNRHEEKNNERAQQFNDARPSIPPYDRVCSVLAPGGVPVPQGPQSGDLTG